MIKSGLYAKYNGIEYKVTSDMDGRVMIYTEDKSKVDYTFYNLTGHGIYKKKVNPKELVNCESITTYGVIEGEKVQILQEKDDQFQVGTGSLFIGEKLQLKRVERDSWIGWISKSRVKIIEERRPVNPEKL